MLDDGAILVHETAGAWRTTTQGNDCFVLCARVLPVCSKLAKSRKNRELAAVTH
jgi:hypothetical protein